MDARSPPCAAACRHASRHAIAAGSARNESNDDYGQGQQVHINTAMIVLLAAVITVFVFIAFFTVYLRHCTGYAARSDDDGRAMPNFDAFISWSRRQRWPRWLDAEVVEDFPTMKYAKAKAMRVDKRRRTRKARVCLGEFEDEERLELPPKCSTPSTGSASASGSPPRHLPRLPLQPRP
ncbi:unnamed protein product [Miscanthus lutarioriparius]|uniref:RING-type E3 ubiquitin transferase n=1 Tax=Miscanthus lutarioriparius TaxID=422564 RepID=A0A811Q002_9POAL|nr:unnamed protein product [Miscanthus lutarioriparius]